VTKFPKCKVCGHKREEHDRIVCHECTDIFYGLTRTKFGKQLKDVDEFHNYIPDNLSYIEDLAKEKGLI
jgi:hypothetical protein